MYWSRESSRKKNCSGNPVAGLLAAIPGNTGGAPASGQQATGVQQSPARPTLG